MVPGFLIRMVHLMVRSFIYGGFHTGEPFALCIPSVLPRSGRIPVHNAAGYRAAACPHAATRRPAVGATTPPRDCGGGERLGVMCVGKALCGGWGLGVEGVMGALHLELLDVTRIPRKAGGRCARGGGGFWVVPGPTCREERGVVSLSCRPHHTPPAIRQ